MGNSLIGTDLVAQVCFVVRDVEKTARAFCDFFGFEYKEPHTTEPKEITGAHYYGTPTDTIARIVVFHVGPQLDLELLEPNDQPSTWREILDTRGEGFHHLGFRIQNMADKMATMKANGYELIQSGLCGNRETIYAYFDTREELKFILELLGK